MSSHDRSPEKNDVRQDDADLARILAYLDGTLSDTEARAFEVRLGSEPELARHFEELAEMDEELRRTLVADVPRPAARSPHRWFMRVAVAASIAVALGTLWWSGALRGYRTDPSTDLRLALVETTPSDADFNELLGFDAEWLPIGMGYRDAGSAPAPEADVYAAALEAALRARTDDALEGTTPIDEVESFLIAFHPERASHVVLVVAWEGRAARRTLPRGTTSVRYEPGRTYLLPGEPLRLPDNWRSTQRVEYQPGILTHRGVDATLAVHEEPIPAALLAELDELLARTPTNTDPEPLRSWLARHAFDVRAFRVEPPGDD